MLGSRSRKFQRQLGVYELPLDQTVRVNFNPGQPCATVIVVVIII
jgi:hypothetical protein